MKFKFFSHKTTKLKTNKEQSEQERLKKGVVAVQNVYEESETRKEANERAINIIIDTIQAHPDMPVGEFLKMVQENTELSDHSLVEIIKQMPDIKSEKATVDAVKEVDLASEAITEIIQEAPVSPVTAQKLVEQIPDEEIQKEQQAEIERKLKEEEIKKLQEKEEEILSKLNKIYNLCENINDSKLVDEINGIEMSTKTEEINESLKKIIAKKVALDYMKFGGPKLPTMMKVMPATEMLEMNLPDMVEKEYQKVKTVYEEQGRSYHEYNNEGKKLVKKMILENIAKDVAKNFEEIGDISIPPIESLKSLNEDEIKIFINAIKRPGHQIKIENSDIEMVRKQLKGDTVGEWKNLKRMLEKMKIRDRERVVKDFMHILKANEEKTQQQKELDFAISEISTNIKKLPIDKQIECANTIVNTLKQQQKIITKNKKQQDATKNKGIESEK